MAKAEIGSISSGTLKIEDLIESFLQELQFLDPARYQVLAADHGDISLLEDVATRRDHIDWFLNELVNVMEEYAPPFCYFGSHMGDGANFGYWPIDDLLLNPAEFEDELILSHDPPEAPPSDDRTYCLHINERGNVALYSWTGEEWIEEWSIV